ncbi:mitochondrial dicarboxylate/tricarboxylate transporter DTC-like [Salvia miltiorrhiza]|uniref:mitochondrial dicarboxylate/tricarboxylate transporter DTC-like n=1 Tax=Salvia miltiorrhiza TaxID=226208 RepID=UPI0025ABC41A|nr:mitochondrial dicarboxylate/tricarboxylate transporter DTC-like [Salvia miltiorrhiza]
MAAEKPKSAGVWPTVKPFVNGGASGMLATCVIQPIDMIKVRIQLGQGSAGEVTRNMLKNDGVGAFYKGLSAGLLRQATYTTARLGSFRILTNKAIEANDGKPLPLYQKALCGLTAGAIGACFGSLADLALIRMQADATLPAAQRRKLRPLLRISCPVIRPRESRQRQHARLRRCRWRRNPLPRRRTCPRSPSPSRKR